MMTRRPDDILFEYLHNIQLLAQRVQASRAPLDSNMRDMLIVALSLLQEKLDEQS